MLITGRKGRGFNCSLQSPHLWCVGWKTLVLGLFTSGCGFDLILFRGCAYPNTGRSEWLSSTLW